MMDWFLPWDSLGPSSGRVALILYLLEPHEDTPKAKKKRLSPTLGGQVLATCH